MVIQIYTSNFCGYCALAKKLLTKKNIPFSEINVNLKPNTRNEMIERSGGRKSVPQIFISKLHIGGYDEISQLEKSGQLDIILEESKN